MNLEIARRWIDLNFDEYTSSPEMDSYAEALRYLRQDAYGEAGVFGMADGPERVALETAIDQYLNERAQS